MMETRIALPKDRYLKDLGQIVYGVGSLEWLLLGDLTSSGSVGRISISNLSQQTTGAIGKILSSLSPEEIKDDLLREWLKTGGNYLIEIAKARNSILHARPATHSDGSQILYRWIPSEQFFIDQDRLEELNSIINQASTKLNTTRPSMHSQGRDA